jgi:CopG family nickel-responsive transcriptional regulator
MQRVTITVDDELMVELDRIIAARGYQNRSEAIRDLARAGIRQAAETIDQKRDCVAALVYVYDHNARQLSKRLADTFHNHHELSLASIHAHLDHDHCMEVTILRGKADEVQHFGEHVIAERGVRHGRADQAAHACRWHNPCAFPPAWRQAPPQSGVTRFPPLSVPRPFGRRIIANRLTA